MKPLYFGIFAFAFLLFIFETPVLAQRSNGITIQGRVNVQQGSVEGAVIQIFQNGRRQADYGVGPDGNYKLELNYNNKFELVFSLKNNFPQKIVVEAAVPAAVLQTDPKFPPFPLNVNLFTEIQGIDKRFSENTVLKIFYSPNVDNFISETYYNDAQIAKLIEQAVLQAQVIGKESDYLSKLTRAEQAEMRKEYNQLLEQARKEYSEENFVAALDGFKAASKILPNEQFPKDRIAEINDLLGIMMVAADLDKALNERFSALIREADLFFGQIKYAEARSSYNRALSIKPTDTYATQQISKINGLIKQQQAEDQYKELIAQGDLSFDQLLYNDAIARYTSALELKGNEPYPKKRIEEINQLLARQAQDAEKQEGYNQAMFQAEALFEKQFYDKSITFYETALKIRPGDERATRKIDEVKKIMKEIADKMMFDELVKNADKFYKKLQLPEALTDYSRAADLFPKDAYVSGKIKEINDILKSNEAFADLVFKADNQYVNKNYPDAKGLYQQALALRKDDKHSSDRIREIDGILAAQGLDEKYNVAIAEADKLFADKNYEKASAKYNDALVLKPKEKYPKDRIAEAERIRREQEASAAEAARLAAVQAEKDKNYSDALARADQLFNQKDYEKARNEYRMAQSVKPEETYPNQKIEEIGNLLAQLSAAQKTYEDAVKIADRELKAENFEAAKTAYNTAKQAKAEETYPAEMIARIDSTVEARARLATEAAAAEAARLAAVQAEKDKNYSDAIARADQLFNQKDYEKARNEYRTAQSVKPEESYPNQKIEEIGTLLAQLSAAQKAYEDAVKLADRELKAENFEAAKTAYNTARQAKSEETYPAEMIAKIDSTVEARARLAAEASAAEAARLAAVQAEKDKNYSDAIARADQLFSQKDYEKARNEYRTAQTVKPEESYPNQKIEEIGNLLAQLSAAQKAYEDAVKIADRELKAENFEAAKTAYNAARQAKSDEMYPAEMIAKIDSTVEARARLAAEAAAAEAARLAAVQAEKDKNYSDALARADQLFNQKDYEKARNEYRTAQSVKPEETYPNQKIEEIGNLLAQLSAAQKAYEDAIKIADRELKAENFEAAKTAYNAARQAKAEETYPAEMIAKIDSTVEARARLAAEASAAEAARLAAVQAEKDKNYSDAIARADQLFNQKDYEKARNEYRTAQSVKPEETYPNQKIEEIGSLLAQLSAAQKAYEDAVKIADRELKAENFEAAKTAYNAARQAKSDETYPAEMIAKIDSTVEARARLAAEAAAAEAARLAAVQAEKDKNYSDAIARADQLFNQKDYEKARNEYRTAQTVKPEESYPKEKITEINNLVAALDLAKKEQEALDRNYLALIQQADRFFAAKSYNPSKDKYNEALALKAGESYPKEKIAEIEKILNQQALDEQYRVIILAADGFFKTEAYTQAKPEYEKALGLKPAEQYPKDQIKKIEDILQREQRRILAEQYAAADVQRRAGEIAQINQQIETANIESESQLTVLYNSYIAQADSKFDTRQYNISRGWYYRALDLKPKEQYPKDRIAEINRLVGGLLTSQIDRDYQRFVDLADSSFRENQLAVARGWYNRALSTKGNEPYPKDQLAEIQRKIAEQIAGQSGQQFNSHMEKAKNAFEAKNYSIAYFWYKKALELRPNDEEAKNRATEIQNLLK